MSFIPNRKGTKRLEKHIPLEMSIPDVIAAGYFELATDINPDELVKLKETLNFGNVNLHDIKMVFQRREMPDNIAGFEIPVSMLGDDGVETVNINDQTISAGKPAKYS